MYIAGLPCSYSATSLSQGNGGTLRGHPGIVKMKSLARNYAWWPNLDTDMERCVRHCAPCESTRSTRAKTLLHPWEWPTKPWHRVQLDYAGPINSQMVLIITDAHSRWIDAYATHGTTSAGATEKLRRFVTHGLPRVIMSDNSPGFSS